MKKLHSLRKPNIVKSKKKFKVSNMLNQLEMKFSLTVIKKFQSSQSLFKIIWYKNSNRRPLSQYFCVGFCIINHKNFVFN